MADTNPVYDTTLLGFASQHSCFTRLRGAVAGSIGSSRPSEERASSLTGLCRPSYFHMYLYALILTHLMTAARGKEETFLHILQFLSLENVIYYLLPK